MNSPLFSFAKVAAWDILRQRRIVQTPEKHLEAALDWLRRAHDMSPDEGVSYGYSVKGAWRPSYRETSGYIIVTLLDAAAALGAEDLRERAVRIARWLCTVQNPDGSFSNPSISGDQGLVFDTGQVLFGLLRAYAGTSDPSLLQAAQRASQWLTAAADLHGHWSRDTYLGVRHSYNTRVAWALLEAHGLDRNANYERVARANLDWTLRQERGGWYENCAFSPGMPPYTHTIAYAIRGLLESGRILQEATYLESADRGARAVLAHVSSDGHIPGRIDVAGNARGKFCCLTGNCQMAIIWAKLYHRTGEETFRSAAAKSLRYVMATQDIRTSDLNTRGAIKGSQPVWGAYSPLTMPNWATKFFVDALLLCREWLP